VLEPLVQPTPVTNTPPTITLLTTAKNQVEAGDEVAVDATVTMRKHQSIS
jgi:hypothetical protein